MNFHLLKIKYGCKNLYPNTHLPLTAAVGGKETLLAYLKLFPVSPEDRIDKSPGTGAWAVLPGFPGNLRLSSLCFRGGGTANYRKKREFAGNLMKTARLHDDYPL